MSNIHAYIASQNRFRPERRAFEGQVELRASKTGKGPGTIVGYAAKFNKLSLDLGGFREKLMPGCFDGVMDGDTACLRNHDDDNLLGRVSAGTLELFVDETGLRYECDLPDTGVGRDTAEMVRRRDMRGSSFQFSVALDGSEWNWDGPVPIRTVREVARLYDVAPVTFPAYEDTDVDLRSFEAACEARKALEAEVVRRSLFIARARLRLAEAHF